jgi:hypothetical protein
MVQTEDGFLATVVAVHEVCTSTTILSTENRFPPICLMISSSSLNQTEKKQRVAHEIVSFCRRMR